MDVVLIGGTSQIAAVALRELIGRGDHVMVLTGRPWTPPPDLAETNRVEHALVELSTYDGTHTRHWLRRYDALVCVAPLKWVVPILGYLPEPQAMRGVFLSSNNVALMPDSADYRAVREAEAGLASMPFDAVILQPTAICGHAGDAVLGRITQWVKAGKTAWLPGAQTLQQPVHYRDVARAALQSLDPAIAAGTYSVSGAQITDYAQMVEAVETAHWTRAAARPVPAGPVRGAAKIARGAVPAPWRRVGLDRLPVNPALPGFEARYSLADMLADHLAHSNSHP